MGQILPQMLFWQVLLLVSLFLVFYNYAGYAVIAWLLIRLRGRRSEPEVSNDFEYFRIFSETFTFDNYPKLELLRVHGTDCQYM